MYTKTISALSLLALLLTACAAPVLSAAPAEPAVSTATPLNTVTAEGKLLPVTAVELAFGQGGLVAEVLVKPGETVAAGDCLVRLVGLETVQAERAAAQLEQTLAQQALAALKRNAPLTSTQAEQMLLAAQTAYASEANGWNLSNPAEASDLELSLDDYFTAEADYRLARAELTALLNKDETDRERRDAQTDFDREQKSLAEAYADLLQAVAENDQPLDEKLTSLLAAIANLEVARELQTRLDDQNLDPEKLAAADARLAAAEAHVAAADAALELYELRAPFSGTLLSLDLAVGETAPAGLPVAYLADTSRWAVETKDLAEIDIAKVSLGQSVTVKLDAFPGEQFSGTVTAIDPVGREHLGDMTYQVTVTLEAAEPRFLWNMTATVNITVK